MAEDKQPENNPIEPTPKGASAGLSINQLTDTNIRTYVYYLSLLWMHFELHLETPRVERKTTATVIPPEKDKSGTLESVYPIHDHGNYFSASVGIDLVNGTRSTGKMLRTIDKMIDLLIQRARSVDGDAGDSSEMPIQIAFGGHEIAKRMAFDLCVSNSKQITILDYDPGKWGEHLLASMEYRAEKDFLRGLT